MAHILLLEPDRLLAAIYRDALASTGHTVVVCSSALTAVQAADKQTPDMVVMELQLVSHSGIEFLYEFRSYADWMNVPLIIHSHVPPSEFTDSREVLMNQLGVQLYLYKPQTTLKQLVLSVNDLLPLVH